MISYIKLDESVKVSIARRLVKRRNRFTDVVIEGKEIESGLVLIVGDRPGPAAPRDPDYHHTPFYSTKHCSGWLNALLEIEQIPESILIWINSADKDGNPNSTAVIEHIDPCAIICLGGNAEKWVKSAGHPCIKVAHPQYWKRFKSKEQYPLIDILKRTIHG